MKKSVFCCLASLLCWSAVAVRAAKVDTVEVHSRKMGRAVRTIVISPEKTEGKGAAVVYLLHGYGGNETTWPGLKPELKDYADRENLIFVCPNGENSWYWDSPLNEDSQFETFVSRELVSYVDGHYRTLPSREKRAITGLSMGGHGAMWNAIRHKDIFGGAGTTSGGMDIRPFPKNWEMSKQLGDYDSNKEVWDYVNQFAEFNNYINSPVARYKDELYNLPFNMNTFSKMFNIVTPAEAKARIQAEIEELGITEPKNLEEQALSLVGRSVYEKLVKGYTEKQWGRDCKELPSFIIKRLPLRFIYDNNYFNDRFQGIPMGGYTVIVEKMLEGSDILLNTDYYEFRKENPDIAAKTVYTGMLDQYFDYKYGVLEYRSVRFETEKLDMENYQGNAVVNYTEREVPYTRIIEHKHFEYGTQPVTVISREYPSEWKLGEEPYYPVNNKKNEEVAEKYRALAAAEQNVIFGGRLGEYRYYDMDKVIEAALKAVGKEIGI